MRASSNTVSFPKISLWSGAYLFEIISAYNLQSISAIRRKAIGGRDRGQDYPSILSSCCSIPTKPLPVPWHSPSTFAGLYDDLFTLSNILVYDQSYHRSMFILRQDTKLLQFSSQLSYVIMLLINAFVHAIQFRLPVVKLQACTSRYV